MSAPEHLVQYRLDIRKSRFDFWLSNVMMTAATVALFILRADYPEWYLWIFWGVVIIGGGASFGAAELSGRPGHRLLLAWGRGIVWLQWVATAVVATQGLMPHYFFFLFSVLMVSVQLFWSASLVALPDQEYIRLTDVLRATMFLWTIILTVSAIAAVGSMLSFPPAKQFLDSGAPTWAALIAVGYIATAIPGQGYREFREGSRLLNELTENAKQAALERKRAEFAQLRRLYKWGELDEAEFEQARDRVLAPELAEYLKVFHRGRPSTAELADARAVMLSIYDPTT